MNPERPSFDPSMEGGEKKRKKEKIEAPVQTNEQKEYQRELLTQQIDEFKRIALEDFEKYGYAGHAMRKAWRDIEKTVANQ